MRTDNCWIAVLVAFSLRLEGLLAYVTSALKERAFPLCYAGVLPPRNRSQRLQQVFFVHTRTMIHITTALM